MAPPRVASGAYLVLEQSPALIGERHQRLQPGLNHLAFTASSRAELDGIRRDAPAHGWRELFAEQYPTAGGPEHIALFLEDAQGFEVEVVATH
ncbi:hypothetical protein [Luteococcus sp. OSA5]|uniref:hypothetical protein n=1 Tax=Luteococcus sp. OSA5 TaxID=3401630 RepID=UPI003B43024B